MVLEGTIVNFMLSVVDEKGCFKKILGIEHIIVASGIVVVSVSSVLDLSSDWTKV